MPPGFYDGVDAEVSTFLGGEVCTLIGVTYQGTDADTSALVDGYVGTTTKTRPAVSKAALTGASRPLFLADDGILNYGTLFGVIVGATGGTNTGNGTPVGPATSAGSGKITVHNQPAVYGVTLDAVDTATLTPTNAALTVGTALYYLSNGLLTTNNGLGTRVGTFLEFQTNGSLVNSQAGLISALNSPSGSVGSVGYSKFTQAVFNFTPPV
ncbi:unnamed protein product [Sphagnum jensenii]